MATNAAADPTDLVFRALASKPRREILRFLASGGGADDVRCCSAEEVCACVFAETLGLSASTVSHHMKVLQEAGLVDSRKRGLWVHYRLRPQGLTLLLDAISEFRAEDGPCAGECC